MSRRQSNMLVPVRFDITNDRPDVESPPPSSWVPDISEYIRVGGNRCGDKHYCLAFQFRKPIFTFRSLVNVNADIPPGRVVFVPENFPVNERHKRESLVFVYGLDTNGNHYVSPVYNRAVKAYCTHSTYQSLFFCFFSHAMPSYAILENDVVYCFTDHNPFSDCWTEMPPDSAFRALSGLFETIQSGGHPSCRQMADLRFFRATGGVPFASWWPLVLALIERRCGIGNRETLEFIAETCHRMLKRIRLAPETSGLPPEFYACEVSFDDAAWVGVQFVKREVGACVEYVSPMVVRRFDVSYKDCNKVECDRWLPFYRDRKTWRKFGVEYFASDLVFNYNLLRSVIAWLSFQTAEKYKWMLTDLTIVYGMVCEDPL